MKRVIIDVREPDEFATGHVEGAVNMPLSKLIVAGSKQELLKDTPSEAEVVVYCRSGSRSGIAADILRNHGYINVINGINQARIEAAE